MIEERYLEKIREIMEKPILSATDTGVEVIQEVFELGPDIYIDLIEKEFLEACKRIYDVYKNELAQGKNVSIFMGGPYEDELERMRQRHMRIKKHFIGVLTE